MDDATQRHIDLVRELSRPGRPLATDSPYATVNHPERFKRSGGGIVKPLGAHRRMHREIRTEYREKFPDARVDGKAIVLAGPPGAGKGSILTSVLGEAERDYLRLDADRVKEALLLRHVHGGETYGAAIKPPEIRDLERSGETIHPLEMAPLVHEESSMIIRRLRDSAMSDGTNLIIDGVLANPEGARRLGEELARAGYDITIVDVEVPYAVSEEAIRRRWAEKHIQARDGQAGALGGRWVPSSLVRDLFDGPDGRSRSEAVARELAQDNGSVSSYQVWRRGSAAEAAHRDTHLGRPHRDGPLMASEAAEALRAASRDAQRREQS
ncbi:zeta toxin family protein [Brachybacterium sp. DNPG3]